MFYAKLDFESFLNHGHELYLTSNGVVLAYADVAPMYLTFHCRPPHEMEAGGLRYEKKQHEAGVGSSREEGTSASASASATGDSPQGEVPGSASEPKTKPMPKKRPRTAAQAADASPPNGRLSTGRGTHARRGISPGRLRLLRPKDPPAMLTNVVTPCVEGWMLQRPSSRRSSTRFSAEPGQTPGISSSLVFCVGQRCRDEAGDTIRRSACSHHSVPQSPLRLEECSWR